jgi:protoporphyrinogen oxidase
VVGDFSFDYTGHLLHLSRYPTPAAVPHAGLEDRDWTRVSRRSFCLLGGRLVPAPVQYHVGDLPPPMREACVASYDARLPLAGAGAGSFRDYVVSGFGQYLADVFLIPQNEKTMATPLDRLSTGAVKRFFPPPDEAAVRRGMTPGAAGPGEYNSQFWYPRRGGIGRLARGLARGVRDLSPLSAATALELSHRVLRTAGGREVRWKTLLSSVPLRDLLRITDDADLRALADALTHSTTISINLGLRGPLGDRFRDAHWIYVPDRDIPFYRVGAYSNISAGVCPPGCSSVYVEVGIPGGALDEVDVAGDLVPRVEAALRDLELIRPKSVVCRVTHIIRCAYVHHTADRDRVVARASDRLAQFSVRLIGRYGLWDYISMEDSIASGIAAAREVAP